MKYVRTKDGRIELVAGSVKDQTNTLFFDDNKGNYISEKDILKQSDTIEKLCDGFIIGETLKIYNKSNFDFERKIVNLGHKEYHKFENLKSIYGVIMTFENGIPRIITVAKINNEGELELL